MDKILLRTGFYFKCITCTIAISALAILFSGCGPKHTEVVLDGTAAATQYNIVSEVVGKVTKTLKNEGDSVAKNETLIEIDSAKQKLIVVQNKIAVEAAESRLNELKRLAGECDDSGILVQPLLMDLKGVVKQYEKYQNHQAQCGLKEAKEALKQAKLQLSMYKIVSPSDGVLGTRSVNVGDVVNIGSCVGTVYDLSDTYIDVYVSEDNLHSVKLGQEVDLTTYWLLPKMAKGKITYIAPTAEFMPNKVETSDSKANTVYRTRVKIVQFTEQFNPGEAVSVHIPIGG